MQVLFWILSIISVTRATWPMLTAFEWTYLTYAWKSTEQRSNYILRGYYNYQKIIPIDVDRSLDGRIFITVERDLGVPASVHLVTNITGESGPLLAPYPNWSVYETPEPCDGIVSVHRMAIDECNRMWMLDTGTMGGARICPAKLHVYNLNTDSFIFTLKIPDRYTIRAHIYGLLVNLVVESSGFSCEKSKVYMADPKGNALVIYRSEADDVYRIESQNYHPDLSSVDFTIGADNFTLAVGIYGLALSPMYYPYGNRMLTFNPLSSRSIFTVDTRYFEPKEIQSIRSYNEAYNVLPSQVTSIVYSSAGTLFYALTRETAIGCWNSFQPRIPPAFITVLTDPERLQFISGMKFIREFNEFYQEEYLLLLSNRFQKVLTGTMNFDEINFRILKVPVKALIEGTICDIP